MLLLQMSLLERSRLNRIKETITSIECRCLQRWGDLNQLLAECDVTDSRFLSDNRFHQACALIRGQAKSAEPSEKDSGLNFNPSTILYRSLPDAFRGQSAELQKKLEGMKPAEFAGVQQKAANGDQESEMLVCMAYRLGQFVTRSDAEAPPLLCQSWRTRKC